VHQFRVTKYNPKFRDSRGVYTRDEWTSFADIGEMFNGAELSSEEYQRVEDAYVSAAIAFLREANVQQLTVNRLENAGGRFIQVADGGSLSLQKISEVLRQLRREEFWCRLEGSNAFVHVGWDYYMYIGVPHSCPSAQRHAEQLGLFVEDFASPYHEKNE